MTTQLHSALRLEELLRPVKQPCPSVEDAGGLRYAFFLLQPKAEEREKTKQNISSSSACALDQILTKKKGEIEKREKKENKIQFRVDFYLSRLWKGKHKLLRR